MEEEATTREFLIFGGNGWIGQKVCRYLDENNIIYYKSAYRADDIENIIQEIDKYPQLTNVMSFIGRTHGVYEGEKISTIDYLEKPGKLVENINDNLFAPVSLAVLCKMEDLHFTYLGTGCIFEYDEEHPFGKQEDGFHEDSEPNFFGSSYSIVKGFTDKLMHQFDNTLNLRIRMPITDELNDRNFISKILQYKKICSIPNSMTCIDEFIPYMIKLALHSMVGTINFTNPGLISHNEILQMYKEIVDPHFQWENMTIDEQNKILASKRSNNFMETRVLQTLFPDAKPIKDAVRNVLESMKKQIQEKNTI